MRSGLSVSECECDESMRCIRSCPGSLAIWSRTHHPPVSIEKPEKATEYFRRAQDIDPDDLTAIEALERLYTRNERWPELLQVYRKKVELTPDPAGREQIYFRSSRA